MSEEEIEKLNLGFEERYIDVTDTQFLEKFPIISQNIIYPDKPTYQNIVKELILKVSEVELVSKIKYLSENFTSRHCTRPEGRTSSLWIKLEHDKIIQSLPEQRRSLFSTEIVETPSRNQPSLIIKFKGNSTDIVILEGHLDSTTSSRTPREPGADDNASGSSTIMDVFRIIATSSFLPKRQLEWHYYACEETGLLGSRFIAQKYRTENKVVYALANVDMTGYHPVNNKNVGLIVDYTSTDLNTFFLKIVKEYSSVNMIPFRCNYACGDHYSWYSAGFRQLTYPQEVTSFRDLNPAYHTDRDLINMFDIQRALEFVKFMIGFAVELSNAN